MNWDKYFHTICDAVASKSPCLSRQIGALLVREHSIVSTGYNGPPRGIPHCGEERIKTDATLKALRTTHVGKLFDAYTICPRKLLGYASGTHLELCYAQHAEENAVSNAARNGVSTIGCTLYMNSIVPCQKCFGTLINAGIETIVIDEILPYDDQARFLLDHSSIVIRTFDLKETSHDCRGLHTEIPI